MSAPQVRIRSWIRGSEVDVASGLLGYLTLLAGDLLVDVTLRRTRTGRFVLSFPTRTSRSGEKHSLVRPVNDAVRREIERAVLAQLGQRDDLGIAEEVGHD